MNQLPEKLQSFEDIWPHDNAYDELESFAEAIYNLLKKNNVAPEIIEATIETFSKIDTDIDWCIHNLLSEDDFQTWCQNTFLNHIHVNGKVYIPASQLEK